MTKEDPKIFCLTPVINEAWILEDFIENAKLWSDYIVIVDHQSSDGSREIAKSHGEVIYVPYDHSGFDEPARRRLLIETARDIEPDSQRILFAVDADEMLAPDPNTDSQAWSEIKKLPPGTTISVDWCLLSSDGERYLKESTNLVGYVDDGAPFETKEIHGARLPSGDAGGIFEWRDVNLLHLKLLDKERQKSRLRWYQVWEYLNNNERNPVSLYRQYHRMDHVDEASWRRVPPAWRSKRNHTVWQGAADSDSQSVYWWDREVLSLFEIHGVDRFRVIDVWGVDWRSKAETVGHDAEREDLSDPRRIADRILHRYLKISQPYHDGHVVRRIDRLLIMLLSTLGYGHSHS